MKASTIVTLVLVGIGLIVGISIVGCERIDAGHVGIRVNLYGSEKGVDDVAEVTGIQWFFKPKTQIYEFPTFVQNAIWTMDETEGSKDNEEFRVTTKDGLPAQFDVSLNYRVMPMNAVPIFKKYRKPLDELSETVLRNWVREGYNLAAANFTAEQLYENRGEFISVSDSLVSIQLNKEGFEIEQIVLLNEIRLPQSVVTAIESKVNAKQIAIQKQQELLQAEADAAKVVAAAQGKAEAMVTMAEAEAKAYDLQSRELTSLVIEKMFLEKWDGSYGSGNVFGGGVLPYKQIGK